MSPDVSSPPPRAHEGDDPTDEIRLAEAVRRLVRGVRVTQVGGEAHERALSLIADATALLESEVTDGPFWQTGLTAFDQFDLDAEPTSVFPYSPAMGRRNPISPVVELEVGEDQVVRGTARFTEQFNGPPFDTCHGGIISLVYDDLIGLAAMIAAGGGMTARLTIDYRRPTPMFEPITLTAWLEEVDGRKLLARGEMRHEGELLSEAEGLFIRPTGFPPGTATG